MGSEMCIRDRYDGGDGSSSWCCTTTNTTCSTSGSADYDYYGSGDYDYYGSGDYGTVTCKEGLLQPLTVPCNGDCNFWPGDDYRNFGGTRRSSHVKCASGDQCVPEEEMCTGRPPLCNDSSDVRICTEDWWRNDSVQCPHFDGDRGGFSHSRCRGRLPGQCVPNEKIHDSHRYNCLDRSDEDVFSKTNETTITE